MRCPKRKRICSAERRNRGPHQHDYNRLEVARALGWSCASGQCHLDVSRYPVPGHGAWNVSVSADRCALTCAAQSAMDPLHHAFWNSHRYVAASESAFGVPPHDHARLACEHATNGLLAQVPEAGQFTDGEMSFQRRFADWSRDTAQPIGFGGRRFSCVHGCLLRWREERLSPTLDRLAAGVLPQRSPKYRRLSEFYDDLCLRWVGLL